MMSGANHNWSLIHTKTCMLHSHTRTYTDTHAHTNILTHTYTATHRHSNIRTYTNQQHTPILTHTHTHIYTHISMRGLSTSRSTLHTAFYGSVVIVESHVSGFGKSRRDCLIYIIYILITYIYTRPFWMTDMNRKTEKENLRTLMVLIIKGLNTFRQYG